MKRIAILLAAVGLGSGCVVSNNNSPPCTTSLTVNWSAGFVGPTGASGLNCSTAGIVDVDVYVDGAIQASQVPCANYSVTIAGVPSGNHTVMVEGFNGVIINRDFATANIVACADTSFPASPGEGNIEFLPTQCAGGYLDYSLTDITRPNPYTISSITTKAGDISFPCAGGVHMYVPWGYYRMEWMEERTSGGSFMYGLCAPTDANVLAPGTSTTNVSISGTLACH